MGGEALRRAMDASTYPRYASDPKGKHVGRLVRIAMALVLTH